MAVAADDNDRRVTVTADPPNQRIGSPAGVFQQVGAGAHYLAAASPYRNVGTSDINATLAAELQRMTTYPPVELTGTLPNPTLLAPSVWRDTDTLDLGYHYPALDRILNNVVAGTLTLTNGVAVGLRGTQGVQVGYSGQVISEGTPLQMNRVVSCANVQEQTLATGGNTFLKPVSTSGYPRMDFRFTDLSVGQGKLGTLLDASGNAAFQRLSFSDCWVRCGSLSLFPQTSSTVTVALTNNLLERCNLTLGHYYYSQDTPFYAYLYNNLFAGGALTIQYGQGLYNPTWEVHDSAFDNASVTVSGSVWDTYINQSHNGFLNYSSAPTGLRSSTDVPPTSGSIPFSYSPPVGDRRYYQASTNLRNTGSRAASAAGLCQHTTTSDNVKEAGNVDIGLHYVALTGGSPSDFDGDGLPDFAEDRNGNANQSPETGEPYHWKLADTNGDGLGDLQALEVSYNVLVNDPAQDYANEQNTQFESTCAVLNGNVIVAYVDSNQGVYGLGNDTRLASRTPHFVGYATSSDNGVTLQDRGAPPPPFDTYGDAGDPVLAVDKISRTVYLVGTSPRNAGFRGVRLWKSTDGGITFTALGIVHNQIERTDKPWIVVDNAADTGQVVLFVTFSTPAGVRLTVSTDGGQTWGTANVVPIEGSSHSAIPVIGSDHAAYVFWIDERADGSCHLMVRRTITYGASWEGDPVTIRTLVSTDPEFGNLRLKRSKSADDLDHFRSYPFPVPAGNPDPGKAGHLYVAYADKAQNPDTNDRSDVFLIRSSNGGATWVDRVRISTEPDNDQWMPVIAVKPDGTRLLIAWYDRRNDANNSSIEVFGRWGTIAADGAVTLGTEFKITTASFPPVFAGTLTGSPYTDPGHYDPVYPPGGVNLSWWYSEWVDDPDNLTDPAYLGHVGEYNGACAEGSSVYVTWTDGRILANGTLFARPQRDIRLVRITWPQ